MSNQGAPKGGRDIVAYFAGYLANLVNGNDHLGENEEFVTIKPFSLYERVHRALIANRKYSEILVGVWAYPPPNDSEDAADFYFDQVLDRPIGARGEGPSSADNLAALVGARAAGPRPVVAKPGALSTWKALVAGPAKLRRFNEKPELFELSNRILKCLDASNRPYAEVLRLGLCPKEWLVGDEAVGVNTLKAANAFLKGLKLAMKGQFGRRPTVGELTAAFTAAPIPGYKDAAAFAAGLLGSAILTRIAGQDQTWLTSFDVMEATQSALPAAEAEEPLMSPDEAQPYLAGAVAAKAIDAGERDLLAAIIAGRSLAEAMGSNLALRRRLKTDFDNDIGAYIEDLSTRTARFVVSARSPRP
jgi:hypothetical protein